MTVKTIYIARHGHSSAWLPENQQSTSRTGVPTDVPLSDHGVNQSRELAHYLISVDTQPDMICTSPFYTCVESSKPIANLLDIPVVVDKGLRNWFSASVSDVPVPVDFSTLNSLFPELLKEEWTPDETVESLGKSESENELFKRCSLFIERFLKKVEDEYPDVETVLLMTHGPVKITLGLCILHLSGCESALDEDGNILQASVSSLDKYELSGTHNDSEENDVEPSEEGTKDDGNSKWIITMNNNTEFLRDGKERTWSFKNANENSSNGNNDNTEDDDYETVYISVDLSSGSYKEKIDIDKNAMFQYSGLDQEHPLIRIGDKLYEGNWEKLVGTELAFPNAASINKRNSGNGTDDSNEVEDDLQKETIKKKNLKGEMNKHGEKIYRITDRLTLRGLQPM